MSASSPVDILLLNELHVGIVDQRSRLECVSVAFSAHEPRRALPQLGVDERHQLIGRARVASARCVEQDSDILVGGGIAAGIVDSCAPISKPLVLTTSGGRTGWDGFFLPRRP